jgi:hypothetical protein
MPIDILSGSSDLRKGIEAGEDPRRLDEGWRDGLAAFERVRREYLVYE